MTKQLIKLSYAKLDPAHLLDGLVVPTNGKKRGRLLVPLRQFGEYEIGFQGFEQLGVDDQSILLAITGQLGLNGLLIDADGGGETSKQLLLDLQFSKDGEYDIATKQTSLRSLLIDAGMSPDSSTNRVKASLNRLANTQIREVNKTTGWDMRCNLISVKFNNKSGQVFVAANPRLTGAVFHGQHIKISLLERHELTSEVAKILHAWLCSNIRLGKALGRGNGAHLDTLAPHVWGGAWEEFSTSDKSKKRILLKDALFEIADKTKDIHNGYGWAIDCEKYHVLVSRPKKMPMDGVSPSQWAEVNDPAALYGWKDDVMYDRQRELTSADIRRMKKEIEEWETKMGEGAGKTNREI